MERRNKSYYFPYNKIKKTLNNNDLYESFEFNTWNALTLGLRDYFFKNSFKKIV